MKFSHALLLASSLAFFACGGDDDDSSTGPSTPAYDCSVSDGVKVVYPAGGETFNIGDKITVIYGSSVDGSGYRFVFKVDEADIGMDLFDESMGLEGKGDGKTCYKQEVTLSSSRVEKTSKGFIRVVPYQDSKRGGTSGGFTVK